MHRRALSRASPADPALDSLAEFLPIGPPQDRITDPPRGGPESLYKKSTKEQTFEFRWALKVKSGFLGSSYGFHVILLGLY